jgi:hypothetical protein
MRHFAEQKHWLSWKKLNSKIWAQSLASVKPSAASRLYPTHISNCPCETAMTKFKNLKIWKLE